MWLLLKSLLKYVKDLPRLINEIPRGSKRYKIIRKSRSSSFSGHVRRAQNLADLLNFLNYAFLINFMARVDSFVQNDF